MTTIVQYIPQWLRGRLQKQASQKRKTVSKKDRQALPTLPQPQRPPIHAQDDDIPLRFRIYWRM
jgi:hypothetical protein